MNNKVKISFNDLMLKINSLLSEDLKSMDYLINSSIMDADLSLIRDIIFHLLESGGKRLRAIIVFIICKMFDKIDNKNVLIAAAIEFIHNATLLHDDVIDESDTRRGRKTSNNLWGNKSSILVGDFLLTMAFQWAIECKNFSVIQVLSNASSKIVQGEIVQMLDVGNLKIIKNQYINMITLKTASLFSAACESAAIISTDSLLEQTSLRNFGINLGIAFQIIDDILDYKILQNDNNEEKLGNDFYNRKITLPVIICIENANEKEKDFWDNRLSNDEKSFHKALQYIESHDAINKSIDIAKYYSKLANKSLNNLSNSPYKSLLIELSQCIVHRKL